MKLNTKAISLSAAAVGGILYAVCALAVWIVPVGTMNFFNYLFHGIDLTSIATKAVTFSSFVTGLIITLITGYIIGWLFAAIHNKLAK